MTLKSSQQGKNNKKKCSHCGKSGHTSAKCWALHPELQPKGKGIFATWDLNSSTRLRLDHYAHIYIGALLLLKACENEDKIDAGKVHKYSSYTVDMLDAFIRGEDGSPELFRAIKMKAGEALQANETKIFFAEYGEDKQQVGGKVKNQRVDSERTEMEDNDKTPTRQGLPPSCSP